jgi:CheY-like chemotaxis protein
VAEGLHDLWIGDPMRLRQVLANLLSNAIKFTPAGGQVVLRVAGANASDGGSALSFELQDSGPGIAADVQARLFRPYEQGDDSIARRFGGTGLGLAICKELLRLMRGAIEVDSTPGGGATFRALVPLVHAKSPWHRPLAPRTSEHAKLPAQLNVLLVEDDEVNRLVMHAVLREHGVHVRLATGGAQALAMLEAGGVDLVLMDCQMAQLDGMSTARLWREREAALQRARVPVIALTGEAHDGARAACHAAGMDDYLVKPVAGTDLHAMLLRWMPEGLARGPS